MTIYPPDLRDPLLTISSISLLSCLSIVKVDFPSLSAISFLFIPVIFLIKFNKVCKDSFNAPFSIFSLILYPVVAS